MTDSDTITKLEKSFLFRGLPAAMLAEVAQKFKKHELDRGQVLFRKGEKGDSLFMVSHGWFKIVSEDVHGDELVLNQCGPGESIGEMALLDAEPRSAGAVALEQAEVLELSRDSFLEILEQRPELGLLVIRKISSRLRFATTYIEKAIEWSKRIGEGDYSLALTQLETERPLGQGASDEDKAGQLLSAFFSMVKGVKEREDRLKHELQKLSLEIDDARRKQEVAEITQTDFYADLKAKAKELRQKRANSQS